MLAAKAERMQRIEELRETERLRQLHVLKNEEKRARVLRHDRIWVSGLVMLCFFMAICFTGLEAKIASCDYQIHNLKNQIAAQDTKNDRLSLEIEDLKSLSRVEQYAMTNLNMVYPENTDIDYMDFSGIVVAGNNSLGITEEAGDSDSGASVTVREDAAVHPLLITLNKLLGKYFSGDEAVAKKS